jgi:hypothetical protein
MVRKLFLILFISLQVGACAATKHVRETIYPDREAIKALLIAYQDAWNEHDPDNYMALFHNEAKIMKGTERRFVSKEEYYLLIPQRFVDFPTMKIKGEPEIEIERDAAAVRFIASFPPTDKEGSLHTLHLVRAGGHWLILKQEK